MGECFSEDHDCIVVYARRAEVWRPALLKRSEEALERYETGE
jgi:adenine-specific DNA-methyltransferase